MSVEQSKQRRVYQINGKTVIFPFSIVSETNHELAQRLERFISEHPEVIKSGGNIYLEEYGKKRFHFKYSKGSTSILELHTGSHSTGFLSSIFG